MKKKPRKSTSIFDRNYAEDDFKPTVPIVYDDALNK